MSAAKKTMLRVRSSSGGGFVTGGSVYETKKEGGERGKSLE